MKKVSNPWKKISRIFQALEKSGGGGDSGAALIVALWVLIILSVLIASFAFDMRVESGVTSYYRKRIKAQALAGAGVEYAKLLLKKSFEGNAEEGADEAEEDLRQKAIALSRGNPITGLAVKLGEGKFTIDILPEKGRRNVNYLAGDGTDADWEEILDQAGVPEEKWPALIDCFNDWVDAGDGDAHRLNGAESDDAYYEGRGYEVKNAPLDTVDELLLIKGFTPEIVFGGKDEDGNVMSGMASLLTTWGSDGKVNVNTASKEVLLTIPGIEDDATAEEIIRLRAGLDEKSGTKDDGFDSVDEVANKTGITDAGFRDRITVTDRKYVRLVSIGEAQEVKSGIWCILDVSDSGSRPVFWREEAMK